MQAESTQTKAGYGKTGKQRTLSNFPTASTTTNYNYLWDTDSEGKVILITGSGTLTAAGGLGQFIGADPVGVGGNGVVRIEAFTDNFTGTVNATQSSGSPFGTFLPSNPPPSVSVISVNSNELPQSPTGSLSTPDVTIDTLSAVTITVQASYIPVGTILTLHVFSDNNTDQTVQTTALAGTLQTSKATATVMFPSGYALNYVKATWTATN